MDLSLSPAEREFRDAVRGWIEEHNPGAEPDSDPELFEFRKAWQKALNERGWAGLSWPTEYGGAGATQIEQAIFFEELARAGAPSMANVLGLAMGGPTVIAHGTDEQKQRYLPPILSAEEMWCQGFSEPESGSDLASLKTRAVRHGDEWVVTGQKVWTTYAHEAKWCMLVARTDTEAAKHRGLTYFLMDMDQDGVEVRPLVQITGEAEFNEVFLDEVLVPDDALVGDVDNGWAVANTTLAHERGTNFPFKEQVVHEVLLDRLCRDALADGRSPGVEVEDGLAQSFVELRLLRLHNLRTLSRLARGVEPGPGSSVVKLHWTEMTQHLSSLALDVVGAGAPIEGEWPRQWLWSQAASIAGGTSEIQRTIIGERLLGLPRS